MSTSFNAPRKGLGQNFLQDANISRKIVAALGVTPADTVIEIGPGRGALTEHLLALDCTLHVVEFDRDLAEYWQEQTARYPQLSVHSGDILAFDLSSVLTTPGQHLKVIGNLPYNLSSPILLHLMQFKAQLDCLVIMLQAEVIDRLCAVPGNKTYGRLSVAIQQGFAVDALFTVPNTAFIPPPKVTSAVAKLTPHSNHQIADPALFEHVVKTAFAQRRKTLRNNFKHADFWPSLADYEIDLSRRAETLSVEEYVALSNAISNAVLSG